MGQMLETSVDAFEEHLFAPESEVCDPDRVHHEFTQGLHGQKVDFDNVIAGTPLYGDWVEVKARFIRDNLPKSFLRHAVLVGVASRTNPLVHDVAEALGGGITAIETVKDDDGLPVLDAEGAGKLNFVNPVVVKILEDVITRGTNSASVAASVHLNRPPRLKRIEVIGTLQRGIPERLLELKLPYSALIKRLMKDYTAEECQEKGYCADGWELIPHARSNGLK